MVAAIVVYTIISQIRHFNLTGLINNKFENKFKPDIENLDFEIVRK